MTCSWQSRDERNDDGRARRAALLRRDRRSVSLDRLRMAVLVDRDIGEIAVGHEDRLQLASPQRPGFEMDGERGATDAYEVGVDRDEVADIDGLAKIHRVDRDRDGA